MIPLASFLLLFPGYFIYHTLIGYGLISAFLSGYWTIVSAMCIPSLVYEYSRQIKDKNLNELLPDIAFLFFIFWFFFCVSFGVFFGKNEEIVNPHFSVIVQFIAMFLVGRALNLSNPLLKSSLAASFVILTGIIISNISEGSFSFGTLESDFGGKMATYQGYGAVYFTIAVFLSALSEKSYIRILIYFISIPCLYINGARSEIIGFLISMGIIEFCYGKKRIILVSCMTAILLALFASQGEIADYVIDALPESRILGLFEAKEDQSVTERKETITNAIKTIENSPITGKYASYPNGYYAHNILSAWVDLGFIGFALYALMFIVPIFCLILEFENSQNRSDYILCLSFVTTIFALSLMAKSYEYILMALAFGMYSKYADHGHKKSI